MLARKPLRVKLHEYFQHLEDSAEKNRIVSCQDNKLPSPRTEAKALFRMVGRNGDSTESIRELIQVQPETKNIMLARAANPSEINRILKFRERVLAVFEELAAKQEKKRLRRSRFLAKRSVPTGTNLNTITP